MTPRRILLLGWLVFMLYAYPGFMPTASHDIIFESRILSFSDGHSPIMTEIWRVLNLVWSGPPSMLFLQSGLLLFGSYSLLCRAMTERTAAIVAASVLVFPPVMSVMAVISEDAQLVAYLVGAVALFASERRRRRLYGLGLIVLAVGMREGAALAAAPIVVFGFVWDERPLWRYAIALNAWIVAVLLSMGIDHVLVDRVTRAKDVSLAMTDVVETLAQMPPVSDADVVSMLPGVNLVGEGFQARARTLVGKPGQFANGPSKLFVWNETDADVDNIVDGRKRIRSHDFRAWARARWLRWRKLLLRSHHAVYAKDSETRDQRFYGAHAARLSPIQKGFVWCVRMLAKTPLFAPLVYLVIALAILPLARGRAAMLLASGALLAFVLAVVTWDAEYRYMAWPVVATVLGTILVIRQRMR